MGIEKAELLLLVTVDWITHSLSDNFVEREKRNVQSLETNFMVGGGIVIVHFVDSGRSRIMSRLMKWYSLNPFTANFADILADWKFAKVNTNNPKVYIIFIRHIVHFRIKVNRKLTNLRKLFHCNRSIARDQVGCKFDCNLVHLLDRSN